MAFNFDKSFTIDLNLLHKLAPVLSLKLEHIKVPLLWSRLTQKLIFKFIFLLLKCLHKIF